MYITITNKIPIPEGRPYINIKKYSQFKKDNSIENNNNHKYVKHKKLIELQKGRGKPTIIVGDLNTPK